MIQLDVAYVFEVSGGPKGLQELLDRHLKSHGLTYSTIQMWKQRGKIAGHWIPSILYVLFREGITPQACFFDDQEFGTG